MLVQKEQQRGQVLAFIVTPFNKGYDSGRKIMIPEEKVMIAEVSASGYTVV